MKIGTIYLPVLNAFGAFYLSDGRLTIYDVYI